ncbi:kinesin-domain-containing protein [Dentipellis sp. KUC8613]|nr:kinesin-domain-containing protein [Dentipellis sp. KUC8613]
MAPSSSNAATTSVQVALRIRPTTPQDSVNIPARFQRTVLHAASPTSVAVDSTASTPSSSGASTATAPNASSAANAKKQLFTFDQVHPPDTTQHALFTTTAKPLISRFLEGFNCTILAYGQTSSGKTFTMTGIDLDADPSDPSNGMGIIPRAVSTIFQNAREMKQERGNTWNYTLKGSFLELYNEDLLDLLSIDENGGRREVQIREGKDGSIIWGGLREVTVKSASEVMSLIRQGTSIRRTNETDMNAQSSRSHAIFSLTLTQRKFTGSGPPPRSSSPLPPSGRSPSRLARPGSMIAGPSGGRVSSPTFGRPGTPSFATAMGRGGLRPASALGTHGADGRGSVDEDAGEWVTVVSKFHFVDLAGSERLKRTAAAGDRIKEGISINSGLLALGNVISALGDPARVKSHTASYVPYRDSKLTRLLQDSLGGNAHTLMIACVSPAEWNTAETVNTLKYANRARNIKNRALITEKEEGWDDVEWLQGMVTRLRKDLKALKEGGVLPPSAAVSAVQARDLEGAASKKMLQSFNELKSTYEDLREKYVARNEELNRLRKEHGESHRSSTTGTIPGMSKYEEIVGPVIEEYEKTISAMEAELSLNRAALRHTNELVEEKEEELNQLVERKAATELYVEELRARVAKLTEREASTEAYVHDLEERIKQYDESNTSSSESMGELKRELTRFKDTESHSSQYITDLETRLARADESVLALRQTVEKLEAEADRRREEAEILQERLETLKKDGDSWRSDIEEREQRVRELELKMEEWEAKRKEASEARERLGGVAEEVAQAQKKLEADFAKASDAGSSISGTSTPNTMDLSLENQLIALQQTHTATLADLSSVTGKYRDALREISDLAAQIQEIKLSNATPSTSEFPERSTDISPRRRMTGGRHRDGSDGSLGSASGRRLFFRQAASTESLHSRSLSQSQSLSQELSLARSRKTSMSSYGTSSPTHSPGHSRPNLSISLPAVNINPSERSVTSLEKEIMRLQDVLKEREQEIAHLEISLKEKGTSVSTLPSTPELEAEHVNGLNGEPSPGVFLSPKTMGRFDDIKTVLENGHGRTDSLTNSEPDESLQRLNDLMRAMAQKESQHREEVENLNDELVQLRRQHDELTALSQNQTLNMSNELDSLRRKHGEDLARLEEVEKRETELETALAEAKARHASDVETLRSEHEEALRAKEAEVDRLIAELKQEHSASLDSLQQQLSDVSSALEKAHSDHSEAFGKLKAEHDEALRSRLEEANATLERLRQEHETALQDATSKLVRESKEKEEEAAAVLARTEEDYYNGLTKLRTEHSEALERQAAEAATALQRLREEHAAELRMAEIAREGSLSESQSSQAEVLKSLQDEHGAAIAKKEADFAEDLERARAQHSQVLASAAEEHKAATEKLVSEHEAALAKAQADAGREIEQLMTSLAKAQDDLATSSSKAEQERLDAEAALQAVKEQQAVIFEEIEVGHKEEVAKLQASHDAALQEAAAHAEQERAALAQKHVEETARLRAEHEQAMAELNATLVAAQEEHREALEAAREQGALGLDEQKARLSAALSDLEAQQAQERETLQKDLDLVTNELASYKAAVEEHALAREEARVSHEAAQAKQSDTISTLQQELSEAHNDKAELAEQVAALRAELDSTRSEQSKLIKEASKRESLVDELEKHRSVLAEMQHTLQRVKDEKDAIQEEKLKHEIAVKDLQAQLAVSPSPTPEALPSPVRPLQERNMSYRTANGISSAKLPPPTPPPSVPPPPAPRMTSSFSNENAFTPSSAPISVSSSRDSQLDSPATSVTPSLANGHAIAPTVDAKFVQQLEDQSRQIEEQETMIKTLNKQLTHCESDLQTHMDLVSTLETSLGDSEKNLRKARMQATELARERDTLNAQIEHLRNELQDSKREVASVRRSIVEEKQSLEHRLDEERRAKERVRQQLDTRMDELQKRKSKFVCL